MSTNWFLLALTLLFGGGAYYLKRKYPVTIWLGISFIGFLFSFGVLSVALFVQNDITTPLYILAFLILFISLLAPLIMIGGFLGNGIKIIRQEGFKLANTISLIIGIGLVFYLIYWPMIADVTQDHLLNFLYQWISFSAAYLVYIFIFYTTTSLLNLWHVNSKDFDYFIVLGAKIIHGKVTPILASRINRAIEVQKAQGEGKFVFTGGQGPDESRPEGEAMAIYARKQGVRADHILKEMDAESTKENIQFSKQMIDTDWNADTEPRIAIVTNNYHVLRTLMLAKKQGVNAAGFGSKTKFYYSLNAFVREFVAYLTMTYKVHSIMIGSVGIFLFLFSFLINFI